MKLLIIVVFVMLFAACSQEQSTSESQAAVEKPSIEALMNKAHPEGAYGVAISTDETVAIADLIDDPQPYQAKSFVVNATVTDVCPMKGCWIDIADADGESIRVKVTDGEIVFPLTAKGQPVTVQGKLEKLEMNEKQHREWKAHLAEEKGESFDPQSVSVPLTTWRIRGEGAVIGG